MGKKCLDRLDQGQVMVQEGKDFGRVLGVRGEVDDGSGQAFGHREIAGLKPPALQAGLKWLLFRRRRIVDLKKSEARFLEK